MSTGVEAVDTIAWANTLLTSDSTFVAATPGGVHIGLAPDGSATTTPFCTLWVQSSAEYNNAFYQRISTDATLLVKLSGPDIAANRTAAARAHTLLHRATGGAQGSIIISCVLMQAYPVPEPQLINGVQWITYIQLYRIQVQ